MNVDTGELYQADYEQNFKEMLETLQGNVVELAEEDVKLLSSKEIRNKQVTKKNLRKIRKRLAKRG